jgi:iron complex outermembrane receptor protein
MLALGLAASVAHAAPDNPSQQVKDLRDVKDIQELSMEDLLNPQVQVATKTESSAEEAPATVEVITGQELRDWGYTSVADALRHVEGMFVEDDHILPNVAVRGISGGLLAESGIIKVMIDGHSVAFRSTAGNWLGPELVPLSAVERIEIIRGPASALYGADAFLGIVNVVTRTGEALHGADLAASGSLSTVRPTSPGGDFDAAAGARKNNFEILAAARFNEEERSGLALPSTSPAPNIPSYKVGRIADDLQQESRVGLLKLSYHLPKSSIITVTGHFATIDRGGDLAPWVQLSHGYSAAGLPQGTHISLYQGTVSLNAQTRPIERLKLTLDVELFFGGPLSGDRIEVGSDVYYVKRKFGYVGVDSNLELELKLPKAFVLVAGVGFIDDHESLPSVLHALKYDVGDLKTNDIIESTSVRQGTKSLINFGAYAQLVWTPIRRYLTLTGGLRYDYHNIYGNQLSGRLAAVSKLTDKLSLKLLYGGAFKAPSPLLLYALPLQVGDVVGNPDLKPQYVHTFELQGSFRAARYLAVRTGLAYSLLLNGAQFTLQGVNQVARNIGKVQSLSWETKIDAVYKDWLSAYVAAELNYTVRETGYEGYLARLIGSDNVVYPVGMLHAGALGRLPRVPLRVGIQVSLIGPRRASEANILSNGASYTLPSYWLLDATIATVPFQVLPERQTVVMLIAHNLIGAKGPDPGFSGFDYPLAPRTIWLQLRQQL